MDSNHVPPRCLALSGLLLRVGRSTKLPVLSGLVLRRKDESELAANHSLAVIPDLRSAKHLLLDEIQSRGQLEPGNKPHMCAFLAVYIAHDTAISARMARSQILVGRRGLEPRTSTLILGLCCACDRQTWQKLGGFITCEIEGAQAVNLGSGPGGRLVTIPKARGPRRTPRRSRTTCRRWHQGARQARHQIPGLGSVGPAQWPGPAE